MSSEFLKNYLQFAHANTNTERGLAIDSDMVVCSMIGLTKEHIADDDFNELATQIMYKALQEQTSVISNNIITDPGDAPVTNTNFRDLRIVVAFPVGDHGVVYLDQLLRRGVITSTKLNRLMAFAKHCIDNGQLDATADELATLYETFPKE